VFRRRQIAISAKTITTFEGIDHGNENSFF
jgi:hypothetical protein